MSAELFCGQRIKEVSVERIPVACHTRPSDSMELKVRVDGIPRVVCGVTHNTTCQDVVRALAVATSQAGRFTLIEKFRSNERYDPQPNCDPGNDRSVGSCLRAKSRFRSSPNGESMETVSNFCSNDWTH